MLYSLHFALFCSCTYRKRSLCDSLFSQGGETPLHRAAYSGKVAAVSVLLQAGADVTAKDTVGYNDKGCISFMSAMVGNDTNDYSFPFRKQPDNKYQLLYRSPRIPFGSSVTLL